MSFLNELGQMLIQIDKALGQLERLEELELRIALLEEHVSSQAVKPEIKPELKPKVAVAKTVEEKLNKYREKLEEAPVPAVQRNNRSLKEILYSKEPFIQELKQFLKKKGFEPAKAIWFKQRASAGAGKYLRKTADENYVYFCNVRDVYGAYLVFSFEEEKERLLCIMRGEKHTSSFGRTVGIIGKVTPENLTEAVYLLVSQITADMQTPKTRLGVGKFRLTYSGGLY